ncbi:MAG: hypothetical protein R6V67_10175 [Spirochaetia bacterium]
MIKRKTPKNSRRFPVLLSLFIVFLSLNACGLESYPYLFPADGISGELAFFHNPRNGEVENNAFKGYELYYRIYRESDLPDEDKRDKITSDMNSYFNSTGDFISVSGDEMGATDISSDSDEGYRRFYMDSVGDSVPLLGGFEPYLSERFMVSINKDNSKIWVDIPDNDYELKRNAEGNDSNFLSFSESIEDYKAEDNDIMFDSPEGEETFLIAIFAVPYGLDNYTRLFANGTSDDMTYLGYFEYNLD